MQGKSIRSTQCADSILKSEKILSQPQILAAFDQEIDTLLRSAEKGHQMMPFLVVLSQIIKR
ncbi:hypothetical protein DDM64_15850 [Vibrio cholerae]|nr:hypothetical protein [Vibrio cholerae]